VKATASPVIAGRHRQSTPQGAYLQDRKRLYRLSLTYLNITSNKPRGLYSELIRAYHLPELNHVPELTHLESAMIMLRNRLVSMTYNICN